MTSEALKGSRREATGAALYQTISVPDDKRCVQSARRGELWTVIFPHYQQGGGPSVRFHAVARKDRDGRDAIAERLSRARIYRVRQARAIDLDPVTIVAGGCHGYVGKLQYAHDIPLRVVVRPF